MTVGRRWTADAHHAHQLHLAGESLFRLPKLGSFSGQQVGAAVGVSALGDVVSAFVLASCVTAALLGGLPPADNEALQRPTAWPGATPAVV